MWPLAVSKRPCCLAFVCLGGALPCCLAAASVLWAVHRLKVAMRSLAFVCSWAVRVSKSCAAWRDGRLHATGAARRGRCSSSSSPHSSQSMILQIALIQYRATTTIHRAGVRVQSSD